MSVRTCQHKCIKVWLRLFPLMDLGGDPGRWTKIGDMVGCQDFEKDFTTGSRFFRDLILALWFHARRDWIRPDETEFQVHLSIYPRFGQPLEADYMLLSFHGYPQEQIDQDLEDWLVQQGQRWMKLNPKDEHHWREKE